MAGLLAIAQRKLEQADMLAPVLLLHYASGRRDQLDLSLPDTYEQKKHFFTRIGEHIRETRGVFTEAVLLMESWFVNAQEASGALHMQPSRHPSRQEAIVLVGRNTDNSRQSCVVQPFTRDASNKPVWSGASPIAQYNQPVSTGNRAEGLLDFLFTP